MTTTTNSGVSVIVPLSILCVGLAMMLVGGWYFQSSLVELKAQQQADWYFQSSLAELKTQIQQLKETVEGQNKLIIEPQLQLQKVKLYMRMIIDIILNIRTV